MMKLYTGALSIMLLVSGGAYAAGPAPETTAPGMSSPTLGGGSSVGGGRSVGAAPGTSIGGAASSQSLGAAPGTSLGGSGASSSSLGAAPGTTIGGHP